MSVGEKRMIICSDVNEYLLEIKGCMSLSVFVSD